MAKNKITIRIDQDLRANLEKLAKERGTTISRVVQSAIRKVVSKPC